MNISNPFNAFISTDPNAELDASTIFGVLAQVTVSGVVNGTTGADDYQAQSGSDQINALGGADTVRGGAGNDSVYGGAGSDLLIGERGADYLSGGDGNDNLRDSAANSIIDPVAAQVVRIYGATLGRLPDRAGHLAWTNMLLDGSRTLTEVIAGFTGSQEFQNTYGST
ncbi:MAG: DUF4214 domain-containing protein, partial [Roseivivax sp.]|nr:DUF4214 domain-containing protein [Roseivivax sp.]